jgi:hypothetical protein
LRRGGTGGIWKGVASLLPSECKHFGSDKAVIKVDADSKFVTLASGATVQYDSLVSTMPLDILLRKLGKHEWADGLTHSSSHVIGVGIRGVLLRCVITCARLHLAAAATSDLLMFTLPVRT